jgi:uncharacterized membrane protein
MTDHRFRRQLAPALDLWVRENLITSEQHKHLRAFYQLDHLATQAGNQFTVLLLSLGGLLVGLGIISLVAANWQIIPHPVRALTALALMLGFEGSGFILWQQGTSRRRRLGSLFLLVGELTMGATIGLMAQWFQVSGDLSGLFLPWSIGILGIAYGLRHTPSAIFGLALWLMGSWSIGTPSLLPWITLGGLLPLAYWCCSRWVFTLGIINLITAFGILITKGLIEERYGLYAYEYYCYFATTVGLIGSLGIWAAAFWHQRSLPWLEAYLGKTQEASEERNERSAGLDFFSIAQFFSLLGILLVLYTWGFRGIWLSWYEEGFAQKITTAVFHRGLLSQPMIWSILGLLGLALLSWKTLLHHTALLDPISRQFNFILIGSSLTVVILIHIGALWGMSIIFVNLTFFIISASLAWAGLQSSQRWRFWLGLLNLALQVLTRFFEYDTGLLLKSLALVACGVGVIMAGLRFEKSRIAHLGS